MKFLLRLTLGIFALFVIQQAFLFFIPDDVSRDLLFGLGGIAALVWSDFVYDPLRKLLGPTP
ncbi:MAG: hypothetical protein Q7S99_03110 [Parvibaculum sp.]|nr:hypothetical protein [Parvibaculum sp.]